MNISWKQNYTPQLIIEKIEEAKNKDQNGKIEFDAITFNQAEVLLFSMLNFPTEFSEIDSREMVSAAIFATAEKGKITTKNFLKEINIEAKKMYDLPFKRFSLVTSISIFSIPVPRNIILDKAQIIFERTLNPKFQKESEYLLSEAGLRIFGDLPTDYMPVRIHVSARTIHNAANKALESIDFLRGIWNWSINRQQYSRFSWGGLPKPVNKIILGPIHTLHESNGKIAAERHWWYEPTYLGPIKNYSINREELERLYKSLEFVKSKIKNHKYPIPIKNAFIRYTRALDYRDWSVAFLKMWGIIELLTDATNKSNEIAVKRAAFLFSDREYTFQLLTQLREFRNSSVHYDKENSEIEAYLYQIKFYVENLIGYHLNNNFDSLEEAAEFLDSPYQIEEIRKKIKKLQRAKHFRITPS